MLSEIDAQRVNKWTTSQLIIDKVSYFNCVFDLGLFARIQ